MDRVQKAKDFCVGEAKDYQGKLGSELLIQMMLSIEKKALEIMDDSYNKDAFLTGIYFHDVGRVLSDGDDHPEKGFELFENNFKENYSGSEIEIIKDCCLNHGSDSNPTTREGKLLKIFDKSVVFEPEVMMVVLKNMILKNNDWNTSYDKFLEKMNKWHSKIPDEKIRNNHQATLDYLNSLRKNG